MGTCCCFDCKWFSVIGRSVAQIPMVISKKQVLPKLIILNMVFNQNRFTFYKISTQSPPGIFIKHLWYYSMTVPNSSFKYITSYWNNTNQSPIGLPKKAIVISKRVLDQHFKYIYYVVFNKHRLTFYKISTQSRWDYL